MANNSEVFVYLIQRSFDLFSERLFIESLLKDNVLTDVMPSDKIKELRADLKNKSTMLHVIYQLIFELDDSHPYQPSVQAKEHCND